MWILLRGLSICACTLLMHLAEPSPLPSCYGYVDSSSVLVHYAVGWCTAKFIYRVCSTKYKAFREDRKLLKSQADESFGESASPFLSPTINALRLPLLRGCDEDAVPGNWRSARSPCRGPFWWLQLLAGSSIVVPLPRHPVVVSTLPATAFRLGFSLTIRAQGRHYVVALFSHRIL